jgi:hypothetical protein
MVRGPTAGLLLMAALTTSFCTMRRASIRRRCCIVDISSGP